jgi:hypothetical protein
MSKQKKLLNATKDTVKLGVVTSVGMGAIGSIGNMVPGGAPGVNSIGAGLGLLNTAQMAKNAFTLTDVLGSTTKKGKKKNDWW